MKKLSRVRKNARRGPRAKKIDLKLWRPTASQLEVLGRAPGLRCSSCASACRAGRSSQEKEPHRSGHTCPTRGWTGEQAPSQVLRPPWGPQWGPLRGMWLLASCWRLDRTQGMFFPELVPAKLVVCGLEFSRQVAELVSQEIATDLHRTTRRARKMHVCCTCPAALAGTW